MYSRFIMRTLGSFSILFFSHTQNIMGSELNIAAEIGDTTKVKNLLKKGVNINERDRFGRTPLIYAALNGHDRVINMLLASHADIHAKDHFDQTAFIAAVTGGHVNSAEILLKKGADPSAPNGEGVPPILIALGREDFEMVDLLLKYGIENNSIDERGRTVLQRIIESNDTELVQTVLRRGVDERYIVHLAAGVGDTTLLKILLKNKIDINKRDALGRTPLLFALLYDRTQCAKMLLDQGADYFSLANNQGKTLLMVAAERRNIEGMKLLLHAGANIFAKDNRGWTALTHAAFGNSNMHNRDKCIKLLKSVMEDRRIR